MEFLGGVVSDALEALVSFGSGLGEVLALTLLVSLVATILGVAVGVPIGISLALGRYRGKGALDLVVSVGMGIPPVLVGLFLLLLIWNEGPLGGMGLVFTPAAMVIAQFLLAVPIAAGVTAGAVKGLPSSALEQIEALKLGRWLKARVAVAEAGAGVAAASAAAFGRVISEVGAVLIVGGNILGETRVLTTLIVQESRQARFGSAVAAGVVLLLLSLAVNVAISRWGHRPVST
ncbi:MAG: ABC transporter permease [Acidimicrobiia bacterium]|nr:ABC transporter permease [Acidimicrobiia bacterium]